MVKHLSLKIGRFTAEGPSRARLTLGTCLAALLAIALLACAQSSPTDANRGMTIIPDGVETQDLDGSDLDGLEEETLLLRYYPPPDELPKVQVVSEGADISTVDGLILSMDWEFNSATPPQTNGVSLPFRWPKATPIDSSHSVVRFHTDVEPGFVFVEGYATVRPDSIGETPSTIGDFGDLEYPLAEYECTRFQVDPCMRITSDGFVEVYGIPAEVLELPHILVFAQWSIDPEDEPLGRAMANWMFHVKSAGGLPQ